MLGPNFFNFLHFFLQKRAFFSAGGFAPSALAAAIRCSGGGRVWGGCARTHPGGAEGLKDWRFSPFLYAISTLEKLFNLSASLCFSLSIRGKVAERFDFQTFQNCSTLQRAGEWLVPLLSPPCPPFGAPSAGVALFRPRLSVFQLRRLIFQSRDYFFQSLGLWGSIHR